METCINYCEPGWAYMSSDERRWINKIQRLAESHPEECVILKKPEDNGGFIYARFPQKWARVSPPVKRIMTDEQRAEVAERFAKARKAKCAAV